jgi:DNA-binding NarL/FixJ family response regulator
LDTNSPPAQRIKIIILEDHPMALDGYLGRFSGAPDIQVMAAVRYGEDLLAALHTHPADVLLLDVQVPTSAENSNPFPIWHTINQLLARYPGLEILVISMHDNEALVDTALDAGVCGYILKDDILAYQNLVSIVRTASTGGAYFSPSARERWLRRRLQKPASTEPLLSPRQLEALSLCAAYPDLSLFELSRKMQIEESTIRNLLSRAYLRLEVSSRGAAVARVRQLGLILPDTPPAPDL